jgi:hypothetical protein
MASFFTPESHFSLSLSLSPPDTFCAKQSKHFRCFEKKSFAVVKQKLMTPKEKEQTRDSSRNLASRGCLFVVNVHKSDRNDAASKDFSPRSKPEIGYLHDNNVP